MRREVEEEVQEGEVVGPDMDERDGRAVRARVVEGRDEGTAVDDLGGELGFGGEAWWEGGVLPEERLSEVRCGRVGGMRRGC